MLGQLTRKSTIQGNSFLSAKRPFGIAVIALASLVGACGSDSSTAPAEIEPLEDTVQVTSSLPDDDPLLSDSGGEVELVKSAVDDGVLTVDFSGVDEPRSMMSRISDSNGERVGLFVTADNDGALGKLVQLESGEEVIVNDGVLSGVEDFFDIDGLEPGAYRSCVNLVGSDRTLCTDFVV